MAQVLHGERTGKRASKPALEQEACAIGAGTAMGAVHHGAAAGTPHRWLDWFDSDEEEESSSSDSDGSRLGMNLSIWDHLGEAVSGVWEVGPYHAYQAGSGGDAEAAGRLGATFKETWAENASRHGVWQARLAFQHGAAAAEAMGNAHESRSPDATDSWVDQYNNRVARGIGESTDSLEAISELIQAAMEDGRLIRSPADERTPRIFANVHPESPNVTNQHRKVSSENLPAFDSELDLARRLKEPRLAETILGPTVYVWSVPTRIVPDRLLDSFVMVTRQKSPGWGAGEVNLSSVGIAK